MKKRMNMITTSYDIEVQFMLFFLAMQILLAIEHYTAQYIQIALSSHSYATRTVTHCAQEKKREEKKEVSRGVGNY